MSRSETSLLKLTFVFLMGLLYLYQLIGGSEFYKYVGIDDDTDISLNILDKVNSFINERNLMKCLL